VATEVKLPRLGQGMESGTIVKWLKSEGDAVEKGEALYELDTDKVTQEVEAEASGVLLKIAVREGEVEVGKTIGFIGEQGEAVAAEEAPAKAKEQPAADAPKQPEPAAEPEATPSNGSTITQRSGPSKASRACAARSARPAPASTTANSSGLPRSSHTDVAQRASSRPNHSLSDGEVRYPAPDPGTRRA